MRKLENQNGAEKKKRPGRESSFECKKCNKTLRVAPYFELYHTHSDCETAYINWK